MSTVLDRIVAAKKEEVRVAKERTPLAILERRLAEAPPARDFRAALERGPGLGIIAEVKKASPSAGVLRADFDAVGLARTYASCGANAISVLTDRPFFQGDLAYLSAIRATVAPPLLRKDFILDPYQVVEARAAGADAVLLIAEILDAPQLRELFELIRALGMEALVELYEPANLARVLDSGATVVGVNNRNLHTFEIRLEHTLELAPRVPKDVCLVSESGIRTKDDMRRLAEAGVKGVLIGETFMRSPDIGAAFRELRGSRS
ncbi:MAG: indole-3-glycerol phosphate synthase TrpC [Gemmataceae bacterium]